MMRWMPTLLTACAIATGCATPPPPAAPPPPSCHQFQAQGFDWSVVRRILLVPFENDSSYPHATFEMQESLAAQLQFAGRFEVILAKPGACLACRSAVRENGCFDEAELLDAAESYHADAILFTTITQYQPYTPPRVGLSLRLVRPQDGAVFAAVDGLWDARDCAVAQQARSYAMLVLNTEHSLLACDLAIESPSLFRRFACHNAVEALVNPVPYPPAGDVQPASGIQPTPAGPPPAGQPGATPQVPTPMNPAFNTPYPPPMPPADLSVPPDPAIPPPALPVALPDGPTLPKAPGDRDLAEQ